MRSFVIIGRLDLKAFPLECQTMAASAQSESAGVDFRRLSDNVPLAACKFSIRALEAFLFRTMAGNEDDECFQGRN